MSLVRATRLDINPFDYLYLDQVSSLMQLVTTSKDSVLGPYCTRLVILHELGCLMYG